MPLGAESMWKGAIGKTQDAILFISKQCIYEIYKSAQYEKWLQNYKLIICFVISYK